MNFRKKTRRLVIFSFFFSDIISSQNSLRPLSAYVSICSLSTKPKGPPEIYWESKQKEEKIDFFSPQLPEKYKNKEQLTKPEKQ